MRRILLILVVISPLILGIGSPSATIEHLMKGLDGVKVVVGAEGKRLRLSGPISPTCAGAAVGIAERYMSWAAPVLIGSPGFEVVRLPGVRGPSGIRVPFELRYGGIPLLDAQVSVHVLADGSIDAVEAYRVPGLPRVKDPVVSAAQSEQSALRFLDAMYGGGEYPAASKLVYHQVDDRLRLCWQTEALTRHGTWLFLVSAEEPGTTYFVKRLALDEVTGRGQVYAENPKTTKSPVQVDLLHLGNSSTLKGSWVQTYNANGNTTFLNGFQMARFTTAASDSDRYVYEPADKRFAEVMGYYHVTQLHDYLVANELTNAVNGTIPVVVNVQDPEDLSKGYDNAFYTRDYRYSSTGVLVFGSGEEFHNFGMDADVIWHEYGHAVLDRIERGLIMHYEHVYSGAIHEGFSDSVAGQMSGNSKMGEWALSYRGSGKFVGRNIDNRNRYPDDVQDPEYGQAESHYTGLIFGGLYWEMRRALGPDKAVSLLFDALTRLGPRADFFDFRDGLLEAEKALYHDADLGALNGIIEDRGLSGEDPGNKSAVATIETLQTRHFDFDTFEVGGKAESFKPGTWVAMTATIKVDNASPGYFLIPRLKIFFPSDHGWGGYEAYYMINEEQPGRYEYVIGILGSPDYAVPVTLTWKVKCRLGDQQKYTIQKEDTFRVE
ncbi:MAG: M36 family metallopeptidase [Acidobacteriota bacterium]